MKTWAVLPAKHTAPSPAADLVETSADGWRHIDGLAMRESDPSDGRLARMRQRIDVLLAEMFGDDGDDDIRPVLAAGPDDATGPDEGAGPNDGAGPGENFWGPQEAAGTVPAAGYTSRHRLAAPPAEPGLRDGHRSKPRHAAPPASFIGGLGRKLSYVRLTGRYAAHAS